MKLYIYNQHEKSPFISLNENEINIMKDIYLEYDSVIRTTHLNEFCHSILLGLVDKKLVTKHNILGRYSLNYKARAFIEYMIKNNITLDEED